MTKQSILGEVVLKPFNSATRRFKEGDTVHADDDFAPLTYGSLKMRHFIGDPPSPLRGSGAARPDAETPAKPRRNT